MSAICLTEQKYSVKQRNVAYTWQVANQETNNRDAICLVAIQRKYTSMQARIAQHSAFNSLTQGFPNCGTRTTGGTQRHFWWLAAVFNKVS